MFLLVTLGSPLTPSSAVQRSPDLLRGSRLISLAALHDWRWLPPNICNKDYFTASYYSLRHISCKRTLAMWNNVDYRPIFSNYLFSSCSLPNSWLPSFFSFLLNISVDTHTPIWLPLKAARRWGTKRWRAQCGAHCCPLLAWSPGQPWSTNWMCWWFAYEGCSARSFKVCDGAGLMCRCSIS